MIRKCSNSRILGSIKIWIIINGNMWLLFQVGWDVIMDCEKRHAILVKTHLYVFQICMKVRQTSQHKHIFGYLWRFKFTQSNSWPKIIHMCPKIAFSVSCMCCDINGNYRWCIYVRCDWFIFFNRSCGVHSKTRVRDGRWGHVEATFIRERKLEVCKIWNAQDYWSERRCGLCLHSVVVLVRLLWL